MSSLELKRIEDDTYCNPNATFVWCLPRDYNREKHPFICKSLFKPSSRACHYCNLCPRARRAALRQLKLQPCSGNCWQKCRVTTWHCCCCCWPEMDFGGIYELSFCWLFPYNSSLLLAVAISYQHVMILRLIRRNARKACENKRASCTWDILHLLKQNFLVTCCSRKKAINIQSRMGFCFKVLRLLIFLFKNGTRSESLAYFENLARNVRISCRYGR